MNNQTIVTTAKDMKIRDVVALMEEQLKVMYRKTDKEKDVFWKAWRKNVNSIWK